MNPDPPTVETPIETLAEGGAGGQARDATHDPSRAGHHCTCGHPIEPALWDMTVFASETTVAYIVCLFNESLVPGPEVAADRRLAPPPRGPVVGTPKPGDQDG